LTAAGRPIAKRLTVTGAQRTFDALVAELRGAGATDLALVAFPTEAAGLLVELRAALPNVRVYAPDLLGGSDFAALAGAAAEGVRVVRLKTARTTAQVTPESQRLSVALDASGVASSPPAFHTASALQLVMAALKADPANPRAALETARPTVLGRLKFEPTGEVRLPVWGVHVWTDGILRPVP
jgi:ABC-type branched-subunit amino acid transport system substrate-binding protein